MLKLKGKDILNFLVSVIVASFCLLIGGGLLIGLIQEPDKALTIPLYLCAALLFVGVGLSIYCIYILTGKGLKSLYYVGLGLTIIGFAMALIAQSIYTQS